MQTVFESAKVEISIHTLAWRVTLRRIGADPVFYISIHTLAWRVTSTIKPVATWVAISIHTLAWRVTATFGISYSEI